MGTAVLGLITGAAAIWNWSAEGSGWLLAGSLLYLVGIIAVTIIFNVPLNNALDAADATRATGQEFWQNYLTNWTFWNHIRTVASILSTAAFALSYIRNN
jgi:uncharacterized membrane protein